MIYKHSISITVITVVIPHSPLHSFLLSICYYIIFIYILYIIYNIYIRIKFKQEREEENCIMKYNCNCNGRVKFSSNRLYINHLHILQLSFLFCNKTEKALFLTLFSSILPQNPHFSQN